MFNVGKMTYRVDVRWKFDIFIKTLWKQNDQEH